MDRGRQGCLSRHAQVIAIRISSEQRDTSVHSRVGGIPTDSMLHDLSSGWKTWSSRLCCVYAWPNSMALLESHKSKHRLALRSTGQRHAYFCDFINVLLSRLSRCVITSRCLRKKLHQYPAE
jgi:hypothetical protein